LCACSDRENRADATDFEASEEFMLDYEQLIFLDAESLAEEGIAEAYPEIAEKLKDIGIVADEIEEIADHNLPSYTVRHRDESYRIYSPEIDSSEGRSWGRATHAFFSIVNAQLSETNQRFYAVNGGNDLGGMFLTDAEVESAKASLENKRDWPYIPTEDHPWYGQHH
jgi:hypothetical protein